MILRKLERLLIIGADSELHDLISKIAGASFHVLHAVDYQQGLNMARKEFPSIIALGYLNPPDSAYQLYWKLKEGWITRKISLLLVDYSPKDSAKRVVTTDERLRLGADEYIAIHGDGDESGEQISKLRERLNTCVDRQANKLKEAILHPDVFAVTWEQIPGRGAFEMKQEELFDNVRIAAQKGKIHAVSITDNPGGNPALSAEILCSEIKRIGMEPLVHMALRDKNRNEFESLLYGLAAMKVRNVLCLTGDYPATSGFNTMPKPVFDLDSVQGLQLISTMNQGLEIESFGKKTLLAPTDFFAGAVISPFKLFESEQKCQYYKLKKKIEAGAKFVISQVGYEARKLHELIQWLKVNDYNIAALANIYVITYGLAKVMNAGQVPGCVVTDKMLALLDEERKAKDKGLQARLDRAAKTYAIVKGMGYAGAHIGGYNITCEQVEHIIDNGEELSHNWQDYLPEFDFPQKDSFYFFERDDKTGLNTDKLSPRKEKAARPPIYEFSRLAHATIFNPDSMGFKSFHPIAVGIDRTHIPKHVFTDMEHLAKVVMFDCQNCGDCGLFDVAFLCPISQCPKNQRNGPCGGSQDGWCEVYPNERQCIWVRAYERLKGHHKEDTIGEYIVPPNDWALQGTASWLNFYCGRDHTAKRLGIKPPEPKNGPASTK